MTTKLPSVFALLTAAIVVLGSLFSAVHAQAKSDVLSVNSVSENDTFALVAELPDQSAIAGMATGMAGLLALHSRRQRRIHTARRVDGDPALTGPLRRLQPAMKTAPDRAGGQTFQTVRLAVTPRRACSLKSERGFVSGCYVLN